MKLGGILTALGILGFCCSAALAYVDCSSKYSLQNAQQRCFAKHGLQLGSGADQIQAAIQNDPEAVCRQQDSYRQAMQCVLNIGRRCLVQVGQNPQILPDVDRLMNGITYLCDNVNNFDSECVKDQKVSMMQCGRQKAMMAFSGSSSLDIVSITCKSFSIAVECMEEFLGRCPGKTREVFVHFTQHYLLPPACHSSDFDRPDPVVYEVKTTMAPMATMEVVTGVPALPHVSCYTQSAILSSQEKCFAREGIVIDLPNIDIGGGRQTKQSYLDALMSNSRDFRHVCRKMPSYQRGMGCAMEVARYCMPEEYKDYLPGGRQVQKMLAELCNHVDDINQSCIKSKASALFDCGYNKGLQHRTSDIRTLLCNAFRFNAECQRTVLAPCGCKMTGLYVKISKEYINPPACPKIHVSVPTCLGDTDRFTEHQSADTYGNGAASRSVTSLCLLVMALAVSVFV